jgi:serine/threonine protein kinase
LRDELTQREKDANYYSQEEAFNHIIQLCTGLQFIHKKQIIHRDIAPQNIFIQNNIFKFEDFGISQILHPNQTNSQNPISYVV